MDRVKIVENSMNLNARAIKEQLQNTLAELDQIADGGNRASPLPDKTDNRDTTDENMKFLVDVFTKVNEMPRDENAAMASLRHLDTVVLLGSLEDSSQLDEEHQQFLGDLKFHIDKKTQLIQHARRVQQSETEENRAFLATLRARALERHDELKRSILEKVSNKAQSQQWAFDRNAEEDRKLENLQTRMALADKEMRADLQQSSERAVAQAMYIHQNQETKLLENLRRSKTVGTNKSTAQLINFAYKLKREDVLRP